MNRQRTLAALTLALCLPLTGCNQVYLPRAQDIVNVELVRVMALDPGKEQSVLVTVSSGVGSSADGQTPQPPVVLQAEGETVFSACLSIQTQGDRYVNYGSLDQCLVSEEETEAGLTGLMDFMERDHEVRMDTELFLAKGAPASSFLEEMATATSSASDRLQSIGRDYPLESQGWTVTVREAITDLADNGCALIPVVELQVEDNKTTIEGKGMAWVSQNQVKGHFTEEKARAAAILNHTAEGGSEEVTLSDGTVAGMRLTEMNCEWSFSWDGQKMSAIDGQVSVKADIAELQGPADPAEEAVTQELNRLLEEKLQAQLQGVMDTVQETGKDLFHLKRELLSQSLRRCEALEEHWEEWYPAAEITITVQSDVERSYDVGRGSEWSK